VLLMKRMIFLNLNNDLKRVLLQALEKQMEYFYKKSLHEPRKFLSAVYYEEAKMLEEAMSQIQTQWVEALPSVQAAPASMPLDLCAEDERQFYVSFCELKNKKIGSLFAFTEEAEPIEVTYDNKTGFTIKVNNCISTQTYDLQTAFVTFLGLIEE
jgi:hypothetical protein